MEDTLQDALKAQRSLLQQIKHLHYTLQNDTNMTLSYTPWCAPMPCVLEHNLLVLAGIIYYIYQGYSRQDDVYSLPSYTYRSIRWSVCI